MILWRARGEEGELPRARGGDQGSKCGYFEKVPDSGWSRRRFRRRFHLFMFGVDLTIKRFLGMPSSIITLGY